MSEPNIFIRQLRESPGFSLAVLFCAFFILLSLTSLLAIVIDSFGPGSERDKGLTVSALQCLLAFCLPAYILARFADNSPFRWLGFDTKPGWLPFVGVVIVYLLSLPGMEWLINWNSQMHFPEALSGLEQTFRNWEENNAAISSQLLDTHTFGGVLVGILIIGCLTGFSEELFFRGALQGIFQRTSIGKNAAVWLAAFIFSSLHFQFFGFLPRLLMGAFFGYLFIWTRSIWPPVFAHALNNSVVAAAAGITDNPADLNNDSLLPALPGAEWLLPLLSLLLTAAFLLYFRSKFFSEQGTENREQDSAVL